MECFISPIPGPDNLQRLEGLGIPFARTVPLPGQEGVQFDESYLATVLAATLLEETGRKALGSGIVQITTRSATVSQLPPGAVKDEVPEMLRSPAHAHIQTVLAEFGRLHALRIIHGYGAGYCQPARIEPGVLYVWIYSAPGPEGGPAKASFLGGFESENAHCHHKNSCVAAWLTDPGIHEIYGATNNTGHKVAGYFAGDGEGGTLWFGYDLHKEIGEHAASLLQAFLKALLGEWQVAQQSILAVPHLPTQEQSANRLVGLLQAGRQRWQDWHNPSRSAIGYALAAVREYEKALRQLPSGTQRVETGRKLAETRALLKVLRAKQLVGPTGQPASPTSLAIDKGDALARSAREVGREISSE